MPIIPDNLGNISTMGECLESNLGTTSITTPDDDDDNDDDVC
jgi:hypothetical protein